MRLRSVIEKMAKEYETPSGQIFQGLSFEDIRAVAQKVEMTAKEVEIEALKAGIVPLRYQRNIGTLGIDGQIKLLKACCAVIGCGGLGGLVIELRTRAGVGRLKVVDSKRFKEENLNRQVLSSEISARAGRMKAEVAKEWIGVVNSATELEPYTIELNEKNAKETLRGVDVAVDALDSVTTRLTLQDAASKANVPLVSAAIAGFCGYVTTIFPQDRGWYTFYPKEKAPSAGIERQLGNLGPTAALAASLEAQEVIKILTGKGDPLRNRFLFFDTENNTFTYIEIPSPV
ncbi:MAG: HesA/MoeB/ThiF family protein [Planctomycetota bacterium]|nr:HesA/MoeB/ThiF family protein [Planctomycetota bacterium]